ncbi:hypothetical protein [Streptomyces sp. SID11385]|uniref:hypothetical protein n=1 Tax=Streptomyces sp. SID11385 TaxID=2706031 RepID=UPI0013CA595E|nr:hypothetical protein [Streptomyces sp. SID11385]NEA44480.1 hypothetical protein [Streptomyces sp. SID11385]
MSDQAQVEHEQWLRGQRQEAYIAVLDAWDAPVKGLRRMIEEEAANQVLGTRYEEERHGHEGDVWSALGVRVRAEADDLNVESFKALERVQVLGPESVSKTAISLENALHLMCGAIRARTGTREWPDYAGFSEDRTRSVMDAVLGGLRTGCGPVGSLTSETAGQTVQP